MVKWAALAIFGILYGAASFLAMLLYWPLYHKMYDKFIDTLPIRVANQWSKSGFGIAAFMCGALVFEVFIVTYMAVNS